MSQAIKLFQGGLFLALIVSLGLAQAQPPQKTASSDASAAPSPTPESSSLAPRTVGPITGSGTNGRIAKFTGANTIGDSAMFEASGKIGIGTTAPKFPLTVLDTANTAIQASGANIGVYGIGTGTGGLGLYGLHVATTGTNAGVRGDTNSTDSNAVGVLGTVLSKTPGDGSVGVRGINNGTSYQGYGVYGSHAGSGTGVYGTSGTGTGVYGFHSGTTGTSSGVRGITNSSDPFALAIVGVVNTTTPGNFSAGVYGSNTGNNPNGEAYGFYGVSGNGAGVRGLSSGGPGVWGTSDGPNSYGVIGTSDDIGVQGLSQNGNGVRGISTGGNAVVGSSGSGFGIYGISSSSDGVQGQSHDANHSGVAGINTTSGTGVYGESGSGGKAGYFSGDVTITGKLTKGSGSFKIDHPLDPAHKYLSHSFVESPDMLNIYNGNAVLDAHGQATIQMPSYFTALNKDFRYQLTAIGGPGPNLYIAQKMTRNHFKIAGGQPDMEVSWQVTGIRHDAYANANRIPVEEDKQGKESGAYLHPELFGQPKTKAIGYAMRP